MCFMLIIYQKKNMKIEAGAEIDGKEVTMLKLKDDINEIRDSKSTFI